jgi:hypothetical protein
MNAWHLKESRILVVGPDDNPTPPAEHNYMQKLQRMREAGLLPAAGAVEIRVHHDDWCGALCGSRCNCDPGIEVGPPPAQRG